MRKTVLIPIAHAAHQVRSVYSTGIDMILSTVCGFLHKSVYTIGQEYSAVADAMGR